MVFEPPPESPPMRCPARLVLPLVALAAPAFADPATQAGADRLTALFQTDLGRVPGVVAVTPEGDSYRVALDFAPIAGQPGGTGFTMSPIRLQLTDLGGGRWHVAQDQDWSLKLSVPGKLQVTGDVARMRFDGIFDAALTAFASGRATIEGLSLVQSQTAPDGSTVRIERLQPSEQIALTGARSATGGVDATMQMSVAEKPPLPATMTDDLMKALLPAGTATIGTEGMGASNALYDFAASGEVKVGPGQTPEGAITVTAKGIEAVSQALGAAPPEVRQKALFMLLGAKGIAKQAPDGTLSWVIGATPEGGMTVNGMTMGKPK